MAPMMVQKSQKEQFFQRISRTTVVTFSCLQFFSQISVYDEGFALYKAWDYNYNLSISQITFSQHFNRSALYSSFELIVMIPTDEHHLSSWLFLSCWSTESTILPSSCCYPSELSGKMTLSAAGRLMINLLDYFYFCNT